MAAENRPVARFKSTLFRYPGPGGWTFAPVPDRHAPPVTHGWGRTPVVASVDGTSWETSVWRDKTHGTLLAVPKRILKGKSHGDMVQVEIVARDPAPTGAHAVTTKRSKT